MRLGFHLLDADETGDSRKREADFACHEEAKASETEIVPVALLEQLLRRIERIEHERPFTKARNKGHMLKAWEAQLCGFRVISRGVEHGRLKLGDPNALLAALDDELKLVPILRNRVLGNMWQPLARLVIEAVCDESAEIEASPVLVRLHGDVFRQILPIRGIERHAVAFGLSPQRLGKDRVGDSLDPLHRRVRHNSIQCGSDRWLFDDPSVIKPLEAQHERGQTMA